MDRQAYLFQALRDMAGYVENGGSGSVKIYQDDATRSWHVVIGNGSKEKRYWGDSLDRAIENAHFENNELIEPQAREV